jgi:hypothetical protein
MPIDDALGKINGVPEHVLKKISEIISETDSDLLYKARKFDYSGSDKKTIEFFKEVENAEKNVEELLKSKLKKATAEDYNRWLKGYICNGGQPHYVDHPFYANNMYIATEDFEISPLYGASKIDIIVPEGIKFLSGELGHIELYFEADHTCTTICPYSYTNR